MERVKIGRKKQRDTEKEIYWQEAITRWKASGLTQAEFCRREELNANTFSFWKNAFERESKTSHKPIRRRKRRAAGADNTVAPVFVRVEVQNNVDDLSDRTSPGHEDKLRDAEIRQFVAAELVDQRKGHCLRIFNGADHSTLSALIAALASN